MAEREFIDAILGLDIGSESVGWALIKAPEGEPSSIIASGVRVYPKGADVDTQTQKLSSPNKERAEKRQVRRQHDRRRRRKKQVRQILEYAGLWSNGNGAEEYEFRTANPLKLRVRALDEPLKPWELGRALMHLAQRRGFQSNRRAEGGKDDDSGVVKAAIRKSNERMEEAGARTYAEFLLNEIDPRESHGNRWRGRYTSRDWFKEEFDTIWNAQKPYHHEILTDLLRERLEHAIFYQRPLKSTKDLIGECEFESGRKRAPLGLSIVQRARMLQSVNNAKLFNPKTGREESLSADQRNKLVDELERNPSVSFAHAKKILGLPKEAAFNQERGLRDDFIGDITGVKPGISMRYPRVTPITGT